MSKLYKKYLMKKQENKNKIYLFKSGSFYIFLGDDAELMAKELGLKLTKFSTLSNKCGFPIDKLDKYKRFIELLKYDYEIVLNIDDYIINDIKNNDVFDKDEAFKKFKKYKEMLIENE
ncbi:MAG: hypothetical protein ACOXZR_01590 [Bacilli bacterium]